MPRAVCLGGGLSPFQPHTLDLEEGRRILTHTGSSKLTALWREDYRVVNELFPPLQPPSQTCEPPTLEPQAGLQTQKEALGQPQSFLGSQEDLH